jgi:hypothetical protein
MTKDEAEKLTDYELVSWAVKNGWFYWHSNDQLRDPQGSFTSANNWEKIGDFRRKQIIEQMIGK